MKAVYKLNLLCAIIHSIFVPSLAQASPGVTYAPWIPGDAGLYIDQSNEAWSACFSRYPSDCPNKYVHEGQVERISEIVVRKANGTYLCRVDYLKKWNYPISECTSEGWLIK